MKNLEKITILTYIIIGSVFAAIVVLGLLIKINVVIPATITALFSVLIIYLLSSSKRAIIKNSQNIEKTININEKSALDFSKVSFIMYDDDFKISAESEAIAKIESHIGESILAWMPGLVDLINGDVDEVEVFINEEKYVVGKAANEQILFFKNITEEYNLRKTLNETKLVLGVANLDNYNEVVDYDTENNGFSYAVKQTAVDYFKSYGIVYRQIKSNRMYLILDEAIYKNIFDDRFSIVANIRKMARKADIPLTISLAFVRNYDDRVEQDEKLQELIDLAISRGGDQVVVKNGEGEVEYHGGSTEAYENKSKVKVRAIANSLKDLLTNSSNVLIVGHENQDADCVSSSIMMSKIAQRFCKDTAIVNKNLKMDPMISSVLDNYREELSENHEFITPNEAINRLREDTLVILVDHHYIDNTGAKAVLEAASKVAIIDHHRRRAELLKNTALIYIEPAASSASELIIEFLPYLLKKGALTKQEANIAYLGILIDTNRFKQRVGSRTFDCLSQLKTFGADPVECDILNVSDLEEVLGQSSLMSRAETIDDKYIIACGANGEIYNRTTISKSSDVLAYARNIDAAFTIAQISDDTVAISARSNRKMNVQLIMERLGGGGHLTMAGVQKQNISVSEMKNELMEVVENYYKEQVVDESNSFE